MKVTCLSLVAAALFAAGCGGNKPIYYPYSVDDQLGAGDGGYFNGSGDIGLAGGTVHTGTGVALTFPPGAVPDGTHVSITHTAEVPPGNNSFSDVYKFEPEGIVFAQPVTISFPLPTNGIPPAIYWTDANGDYQLIGGTVVGDTVQAQITHFSKGYVGPSTGQRTVTGARTTTWLLADGGIVLKPSPMDGDHVSVLVPEGNDYAEIQGLGTDKGTFSVPNVPAGRYLLKVNSTYYDTSADVVDLGSTGSGRFDAVSLSPTTSTQLRFSSLTGLSSWQSSNVLQVFSPNAHSYWLNANTEPNMGVSVGATNLSGKRLNLQSSQSQTPTYLPDGSKGDYTFVAQMTPFQAGGGVSCLVTSRIATFTPTAVVGGLTSVSGAFSNVGSQRAAEGQLEVSSFLSLLTNVAPNPSAPSASFAVQLQAGGLTQGSTSLRPDAVRCNLPVDGTDVSTGAVSYGIPTTGVWGQVASISVSYTSTFNVTGVGLMVVSGLGATQEQSLDTFSSDGFSAALAPVRNPRVAGGDAMGEVRSGVGTTPLIDWDLPSQGRPDRYVIEVLQLVSPPTIASQPANNVIATFVTAQPKFRVPPHVLGNGGQYALRIRAEQNGYPNRDRAPNRDALPRAWATVVTNIIVP